MNELTKKSTWYKIFKIKNKWLIILNIVIEYSKWVITGSYLEWLRWVGSYLKLSSIFLFKRDKTTKINTTQQNNDNYNNNYIAIQSNSWYFQNLFIK
jgi:hypothetical protein